MKSLKNIPTENMVDKEVEEVEVEDEADDVVEVTPKGKMKKSAAKTKK